MVFLLTIVIMGTFLKKKNL